MVDDAFLRLSRLPLSLRGSLAAIACATAALLSGCAQDDKPAFRALVVFGDSLSDVGTYTPVTSVTGDAKPPFIGGKFTTNGAEGLVWPEMLASQMGLTITPHEVGYGPQSTKCPSNNATCTGYAQGGSRVTNPDGIGKQGGALTVPVKTQIANHLSRFGGFRSTDLVVVYAGNNDIFVQFNTFAARATQIQTDAAAGRLTRSQADQQSAEALAVATVAVQQAANELVGYVKSEVLAKGADFVVVANLPDSAKTPTGAAAPETVRPILSGLVKAFNDTLSTGLAATAARIWDSKALGDDVAANPSRYGFTNTTDVACDPARISAITRGAITDGTSLFCNATPGLPYFGLKNGANPATWQFADGVHPTTGGHKVIAQKLGEYLVSLGWL